MENHLMANLVTMGSFDPLFPRLLSTRISKKTKKKKTAIENRMLGMNKWKLQPKALATSLVIWSGEADGTIFTHAKRIFD